MQILKRSIVIIIIFVILSSMFVPKSLASDYNPDDANPYNPGYGNYVQGQDGAGGKFLDQTLTWGAGILYYPIQLVIGVITELFETVASALAYKQNVTPEDVLFNNVPIVDVNFFAQNSSEVFTATIRDSVASWYYGIRTIAIVASLCVLIYISIRMAISSAADDKGKYKVMLKDWAVSFALVFILHYIMMLVLYGNNLLVDIFKTALDAQWNGKTMEAYLQSIKEIRYSLNLDISVTEKFGAHAVTLMMAVLTIMFIIMYIKRFIVVAFLIMIAPLITITYAIDKVGDGKSQAMNTWFKEFFWTIIIQPFHCLIYLVFASVSIGLVQNGNFASSMLAIFCMGFILQAEDIVKKIFQIQADDIGKLSAASALVVGGAMGTLKRFKPSDKDKKQDEKKKPEGPTIPNTKGAGGAPNGPNSPKSPNPGDINTKGNSGSNINAGNMDNSSGASKSGGFFNSERVDGALDKFQSVLGGMRAGKDAVVGIATTSTKLGLATAGAITGAVTGDFSKITGGALAGYLAGDKVIGIGNKLNDKVFDAMNSPIDRARLKNREYAFDQSYENYKNDPQNIGKSPKDITREVQDLIRVDLSQVDLEPAKRKLVENLQSLYAQYEKSGHDNPEAAVITKLHLKEKE